MKLFLAVLCTLSFLPAVRALAQQDSSVPQRLATPPSTLPSVSDVSPFDVSFGGAFALKTSLEGGGGFSKDSWSSDVVGKFPIAPGLFGHVGFGYTQEVYNFSGNARIGRSDKPWTQIDLYTLSAGLFYRYDDHWSFFGDFNVRSAGQTGADFGETVTYGGVAGVLYRYSDRLSLGAAVVTQSVLEDSVTVVPFPAIRYLLPFDQDRWTVFCGGGPDAIGLGSNGVVLGVAYKPFRELTITGGLSSLGLVNDFRLRPGSALSSAVVRDKDEQFIIGANYRPVQNISIAAFIGVDVPGNVRVISNQRVVVYNANESMVPVVGLSLDFRF